MIKPLKFAALLALAMGASAAQASGPLIVSNETGTLKPLVWDMANGPIPVWTDGGGAFTYDVDGVTPFVTIERANAITANAFLQWTQVPTATFAASIQGTIKSQTGVADVTSSNITDFIGTVNGHGFWIIYDTDGSIMEDFFGVSKGSVLGISSPEFGDGEGHITESWTVLNGWAVIADDTGASASPDTIYRNGFGPSTHGSWFAGVFTHEIGHAINLSHSQTNGQMGYQSYAYAPLYPGVPGCVDALYRYDYPATYDVDRMDPAAIETMFPFIDPYGPAGAEQASVNVTDDITGISNLYPTADYLANTGTISGVLHLKDGSTEYSGINVIARNINDPLFDAVSDMTGSATQGQIGADGHYAIRGLTPGAQYRVYIEQITSGGYPTRQQMLLSPGEYWNADESANPVTDLACAATPITAEAGVTSEADLTFNGFSDGVQFTPLVAAYMTSLSTDGSRAGGTAGGGTVALMWDKDDGLKVLPVWLGSYNGTIDGPGTHMAVQVDPDGNGIKEPAIWSEYGPLQYLGDLTGGQCGGSSVSGKDSATGMDMDTFATHVVGLAYVDRDGDGSCGSYAKDEVVPFIWDQHSGMRILPHDGSLPWTRASAISGNGRVVLGTSNFQHAWVWIDEQPPINLTALTGATDVNTVNYDGSVIAVSGFDRDALRNTGVIVWNSLLGTDVTAFTNIDSLRYCVDVPLMRFGNNMCESMSPGDVYAQVGVVPVNVFGTNDAGTVLVGRAGNFFSGTYGAIWIKDIGWMTIPDFLHTQGVVEAENFPIDNPLAISGSGDTIMGGLAGVSFSWLIDLHEVYVCEHDASVATTFPDGMRAAVADGAQVGRCEFID